MIRDKFDVVTVGLIVLGTAFLAGALSAAFVPDYALHIVVGAMALPLLLGGWKHLSLNGRGAAAHIEQTERANYALYLANQERERRLSGGKPAAAPDYARDWREAAVRFMAWGLAFGFTIRELAWEHSPGRCVSWGDWKIMVEFLKEAGVLVGAGTGTRLADDWTRERWEAERHTLPLPVRDYAPPAVSVPQVASQQRSQQPQQA